ncbi:MAG: hypothetical protein ACE144_02730 [Thermodesulfobacteriota bacterium]
MSAFLRVVFFSVIIVVLLVSLSYAIEIGGPKTPASPPPSPVQPKVPGKTLTAPDDPVIREFTGPAYPVVQGTEVTLRWRVEPGPGGSPITNVSIIAPYLPDEPSRPIGERRFLFLGGDYAEDRPYRLTATNGIGRSASRTLTVRHILIRDALDQLGISLRANPPEFRAGRPVDLAIDFSNREGAPLLGMNIIVTHGGRTVGSLRDVRVGHGTGLATFRLPDTGFTGAPGEYTVDVEYRGVHRSKRFGTVPAPYFVIRSD